VEVKEISRMLSRSKKGFKVIGHNTDAEKAIDEIISFMPDFVITDMYMRKMSGIALMQWIKEAGIECKFIIYSDRNSIESDANWHEKMRDFFHGGGFDYWRKPLNESMIEEISDRTGYDSYIEYLRAQRRASQGMEADED
jgi:response regulator of citrate/malate metabolism